MDNGQNKMRIWVSTGQILNSSFGRASDRRDLTREKNGERRQHVHHNMLKRMHQSAV